MAPQPHIRWSTSVALIALAILMTSCVARPPVRVSTTRSTAISPRCATAFHPLPDELQSPVATSVGGPQDMAPLDSPHMEHTMPAGEVAPPGTNEAMPGKSAHEGHR